MSSTTAMDGGSSGRTSSTVPWTRTATSCRWGASARVASTRAAGSKSGGTSKEPASTVGVVTRSSRKSRTWPLAESAPVTYQRAACATMP